LAGAWIYILECADGSFYTGLTRQQMPEGRTWEHSNKVYANSYTSRRLPVRLCYAEYYESISEVISAERRIKGWSRAKKIAMMDGDWEAVMRLSKRRGGA